MGVSVSVLTVLEGWRLSWVVWYGHVPYGVSRIFSTPACSQFIIYLLLIFFWGVVPYHQFHHTTILFIDLHMYYMPHF